MADEAALSRLQTALEQIADVHDARVDKHEMEDGTWIVAIEHDDWSVTGSGFSEAQAYSDVIKNARDAGYTS